MGGLVVTGVPGEERAGGTLVERYEALPGNVPRREKSDTRLHPVIACAMKGQRFEICSGAARAQSLRDRHRESVAWRAGCMNWNLPAAMQVRLACSARSARMKGHARNREGSRR